MKSLNSRLIVEGQAKYIAALERRCKYAEKIVDRVLLLERELGLAKAGIADLKHQLFLIGSEEAIQEAINNYGGYDIFPVQYTRNGKKKVITKWKSK